MKKILKKFLVIAMFFTMCINYIFPIYVYAESDFDDVQYYIVSSDAGNGRKTITGVLEINREKVLNVSGEIRVNTENAIEDYETFYTNLVTEYFNLRLRMAIIHWMDANGGELSLQVAGDRLEEIALRGRDGLFGDLFHMYQSNYNNFDVASLRLTELKADDPFMYLIVSRHKEQTYKNIEPIIIGYVNNQDNIRQIIHDTLENLEERIEEYGEIPQIEDLEVAGTELGQQHLEDRERTLYDNTTIGQIDPINEFNSGPLDAILGILLYPLKLNFVMPAIMLNFALSAVGGPNTTVETIFFNNVELTKINVFEPSDQGPVQLIRDSIASFYIAFRNLAIAMSLVSLIYIGIRMAISSVAEDKARYKQLLINWVVGFALIFVLHFIIIIMLTANDMLIKAIGDGTVNNTRYMTTLQRQVWYIPLTISFSSLFMYCILLVISLVFLIRYIKRMLTVSFLITISPLVCVTYAVDKVGNNKAEILNTWLREFLYNVLIQPFHCIIYAVLIGIAMKLVSRTADFGGMLYAVILTLSIFSVEKLIKEIFGFKSSTLSEKVAILAIASKTISTAKQIGAMKGSANDRRAKKQQTEVDNKVGGLINAGEGKLDANEIARLRMNAEEHSRENTSSSPKGGILRKSKSYRQ
ncbi:MAG: hypothetical protein IKP28_02385 [Clostridia bacterium]|nr:hypothetical protein [Clostridia bacterium]